MTKYLIIVVALIGSSCSSYTFKEMESISSKMSRFQPKHRDNFSVPRIPVKGKVIAQLQTVSRFPASVTSHSPISSLAKRMNNKNLYFATLLEQYRDLQQYSEQRSPAIKSCPHFHSTLLHLKEQNSQIAYTPLNYTTRNSSKSTPVEFFLPISFDSTGAKVIDFPTTQRVSYLKKAINIHLQKMHKELQTMCQTGSSDSYYVFENLAQSEVNLRRPSKQAASILLKMPIFTNELLLNSLAHHRQRKATRSIASVQTGKPIIFHEVSNRLKINWFTTYIKKY